MTLTPSVGRTSRTPARDRLIAAADELFYAGGIQTVGVDRIIEHAGVSRASFYNNFDSKEQLIHTYLLGRHDRTIARLTEAATSVGDPRQKILAVFDSQAELTGQPDFNGCAFVAASTEAPTGSIVHTDGSPTLPISGAGSGPCSPTWPARRALRTPAGSASSST
jgi:AcrR family transcriptional regulator